MQSTEAMRVAIDEGSARAVETLIGTNERLRGELSEVLGRLQDASILLQQVSASASGNLGAVEDGLSSRVQQIEGLLSRGRNTDRPRIRAGRRPGRGVALGFQRRHSSGHRIRPHAR